MAKRYFKIETVVVLDDTEETGPDDSAAEYLMSSYLNVMLDSVIGRFKRSYPDAKVTFEDSDLSMQLTPFTRTRKAPKSQSK